MDNHHNHNKPYIDFDHVSKAFGSKVILDDVSFNVMPGETVCILGRSGVGKSVSLHSIMGFLKPDSGRVIVASQDIRTTTKPSCRRFARKSRWYFKMEPSSILCRSARMLLFPCAKKASFQKSKFIKSSMAYLKWSE